MRGARRTPSAFFLPSKGGPMPVSPRPSGRRSQPRGRLLGFVINFVGDVEPREEGTDHCNGGISLVCPALHGWKQSALEFHSGQCRFPSRTVCVCGFRPAQHMCALSRRTAQSSCRMASHYLRCRSASFARTLSIAYRYVGHRVKWCNSAPSVRSPVPGRGKYSRCDTGLVRKRLVTAWIDRCGVLGLLSVALPTCVAGITIAGRRAWIFPDRISAVP